MFITVIRRVLIDENSYFLFFFKFETKYLPIAVSRLVLQTAPRVVVAYMALTSTVREKGDGDVHFEFKGAGDVLARSSESYTGGSNTNQPQSGNRNLD